LDFYPKNIPEGICKCPVVPLKSKIINIISVTALLELELAELTECRLLPIDSHGGSILYMSFAEFGLSNQN
jgi:hypothetical protein